MTGAIVLGWLTKLVVAWACSAWSRSTASRSLGAVPRPPTAPPRPRAPPRTTTGRPTDVQKAYNAAAAEAAKDGDTVEPKTFSVAADGLRDAQRLHHEATTIWMHRVGFLKRCRTVRPARAAGDPPRRREPFLLALG